MAMTLVQLWQQERDIREAAQSAAQNDLSTAQLALIAAKAAVESRGKAIGQLTADIAANRAKLAASSVPSEVTALNTAIRDQIIALRAQQGGLLDDQDAASDAQADADAAAAVLTRMTANLADVEARLAAAKDANKQRQLLKARLSLAPFDTLQADATAFAGGAQATDAKAEIDAIFPAPLQTLAAKRYDTRMTQAAQLRQALTDAENALGAARATNDGRSGEAAKAEVDFRHAEQALRDFTTTAKQRFDRAVGIMTDLQATKKGTRTPDLLTAQEKLDIGSSAERQTAETNAEPVDANRRALDTARRDLDAEIVKQINTDVDALPTSADVKTKRDAVATAANTLRTSQSALVASGDRAVLDRWEVVVQDPAWRALIDYFDASATLTELKAVAPASLGAALDTAEDAYATALVKALKAARQSEALSDVVAARAKRVEGTTAALPGRLLSAVRGDSF